MRVRVPLGIALLLSIVAVCPPSLAAAGEMGRLAMIAARQDLRDEVCYFMADGVLTPTERHLILEDAKNLLPHDEYLRFKQALNRIAPPPKPTAKQLAKKHSLSALALQQAPLPPNPPAGPVIPTSAIQPERMAPVLFLR